MKKLNGLLLTVALSGAWIAGAIDAHAADCNPKGNCVNDDTYVFYSNEVHLAKVKTIASGGTLSVLVKGDAKVTEATADRVAIVADGKCSPQSKAICNGETVTYTADGKSYKDKVVGYFNTGFIVVEDGEGGLHSVKPDTLTPSPAKAADEEADLKAAAKLACSALETAKRPQEAQACRADHGAVPTSHLVGASSAMDTLVERARAGEQIPLHDYLLQWNPSKSAKEVNPGDDNSWEKCRDNTKYNHPVRTDAQGELLDRCRPDTLYSWGPLVKIQDLEKNMGDGKWGENPFFNNALFLSETPASSFGYGSLDASGGYAMRVKLKKSDHFRFITGSVNCNALPDPQNSVYIRVFMNDHGGGKQSSGADFILCSSHAVESWSYGTREFYDELSKDVSRVTDPKFANDWFSYMRRPDANGVFQPSLWSLESDSHPFTKEQLINTLNRQLLMSADKKGHVYYNSDSSVPNDQKTNAHFATTVPMWFNDHKASDQ